MKNLDLPIRYVLAVLVGIFYQIFYWIFSPWTLHSTYWILNLVYNVVLEGNLITFDSVTFALIPACTAATAYLLLTMLILVTRGIKLLTRIKIWIYGCLLILVFNTLRIFLLIWIYVTFGQNYFDALHLMFWHVVSTVVVILIWIGLTKKYKVKGIPVYSDLKYILSFR